VHELSNRIPNKINGNARIIHSDMNIYLGCPIWSFKGWVGNFYPVGTKPAKYLHEYAKRLTTIEGNTTFYAVPSSGTVEGWVAETPATFRFCPKIPKAVSHGGKLVDQIDRARHFTEVMDRLGVRLGPMFLQLPPRYSPGWFDDLRTFLEAWPREFRLAVEVRHLDWFDSPHSESLDQLLIEHNMARVVIDTRPIRNLSGDKILEGSVYQTLLEARERKPDVPVIPRRTTDFVFVRYIGHPQLGFNRPFLDEWRNYFVSQLREGSDVYMFCHSPDNMTAPWLCRELHRQIALSCSLPPLPWDEADSDNFEQARLF
jgi:uncharacterized protein YecE (DUF72 family)